MRSVRFTPRRYQLNKQAAQVAKSGHPWIFRKQLSSAAAIFKDGQWLQLVGHDNEVIGYGIYQQHGLQGIRILKRGKDAPSKIWLKTELVKALGKREKLVSSTNAYRVLHGENDGFPGIVFDVYTDVGVLQTYSTSVDVFGRFCAAVLRDKMQLKGVLWKFPKRRAGKAPEVTERVLFGKVPEVIDFKEGSLQFSVDLRRGQKSGSFLDLRGLRRWLAKQSLKDKTVLNLFSYTGMLGLCAHSAGATKVINVDDSAAALAFGEKHHSGAGIEWRRSDIFAELQNQDKSPLYDVIVCDPPLVAANQEGVAAALDGYRRIFTAASKQVKPGGYLICCCCTSRISRGRFLEFTGALFARKFSLSGNLSPEIDHPSAFDEGDYLKILIYKKATG
jgi:23S rRNA (cytosine1962-C5)-methyltransferase